MDGRPTILTLLKGKTSENQKLVKELKRFAKNEVVKSPLSGTKIKTYLGQLKSQTIPSSPFPEISNQRNRLREYFSPRNMVKSKTFNTVEKMPDIKKPFAAISPKIKESKTQEVPLSIPSDWIRKHSSKRLSLVNLLRQVTGRGLASPKAHNNASLVSPYLSFTSPKGDYISLTIDKTAQDPQQNQFFNAIKNNEFDTVQEMLKANPKLSNVGDSINQTGLHWAAKRGYVKILQILVKCEADVNAQDIAGKTPLMLAVRASQLNIIKALMNCYADPFIKSQSGASLLDFCGNSTKQLVLKYQDLYENGGDITRKEWDNRIETIFNL